MNVVELLQTCLESGFMMKWLGACLGMCIAATQTMEYDINLVNDTFANFINAKSCCGSVLEIET